MVKIKRYLNTDLGIAFLKENNRYYINYHGTTMYLHRAVFIECYGNLKFNRELHHVDGDRYNNHINNLVAVTSDVHKMLHKGHHEHDYEVEIVENSKLSARFDPPMLLTWGGENLANVDKYDNLAIELGY